ncbi:MgtC/SapB family protein [Ectopseudomonas mendocina]|uniref:Protein MgtC n=1 Tax=Ectopseudomonas mendocina TaxID=300 RepID=A0ABZ2REM9_ECTME
MGEFLFAINLLAALLLGALIGVERQWRQRLSVLRTNALVCLGAASFTVFAGLVDGDSSPTRVAAQIVSGIGFLGAGVIMRDGLQISGLNTAATLWCSAAVGILAGAGFLLEAATVTGLILMANVALRPVVRMINRQPQVESEEEQQYAVSVTCLVDYEAHIRSQLTRAAEQSGLRLLRLDSKETDNGERCKVSALLEADQRSDQKLENCIGRLSVEPGVTGVRWRIHNAEL